MADPSEPQDADCRAPIDLEQVSRAFGAERLAKYLARAGGDVGLALDLYGWNQESARR